MNRFPRTLQASLVIAGLLTFGACTREEARDNADRVGAGVRRAGANLREGVRDIKEDLPPAHEVKENVKEASRKTGHAVRELGEDVVRETKATRDLVRERSREDN